MPALYFGLGTFVYCIAGKFGEVLIWQFGGLQENHQIKFCQY